MKNLPQKISLVAQTVSVLKEEIQAGRWSEKLPGEHELRALLHVGRVTLRSAFAQLQREGWIRVSQGKRRQIVRRHPTATVQSDRVILLVPQPLEELPPQSIFWIDGLREHLSKAGYHLEMHDHLDCYSGKPERALESLTQRSRAAGWVLTQSTARMQRWFAGRAMRCIIVGSRHEEVRLPSLDRDYRAISRHAAGVLLARGHRRLALVCPTPVLAGDRETEEGFKEALQRSHLPHSDINIIAHDCTVSGICAKLDLLLKRSQPPTGLLVARSYHVLTVMSHLMTRGLRFPKDIALISRDDDSFLASMVPSVARYCLSHSLLTRTISNLVVTMLRSGLEPKEHRLMPEFVPGQTLG